MAISYREVLNWYARLWPRASPKPPYRHIVQMGDPVLRQKTTEVAIPAIRTQQVNKTISMMKFVMERYGSVGLSAPQIGIDQRIFAIELKQSDLKFANHSDLKPFPFMVFINPQMSLIGMKKNECLEACCSIKGFSAKVTRHNEVKIQAYNQNAEEFSVNLKGWLARIAQHEIDHLNGKFFTDIMDKESLFCTCWEEVNKYEGKVTLPFAP